MQNYDSLIWDELVGDTPKQKFEYLKKLQDDRMLLIAKVVSARSFMKGLVDSPPNTELIHLKSVIDANYENISKYILD
jgi:hypothetical protein